MKINVDKKDISVEQMNGINHFEKVFTEMLEKFLKMPDYRNLRVLPTFTIVKRKGAPVSMDSNAGFDIPGSRDMTSNVLKWLKDYDELEVYLPKHTLHIDLQFKASDKDSANTSRSSIDELPNFTPTEPRHSFDKIILPEDVRKRIMEDLSIISKTELVYKTWGFEEVDNVPRLVLSLYGNPGTGKTMIAHAIARHFGKPLLALNYSEIESKYVGDAAKNLKHAFDVAREMDAILFFDEADSFLGKRIQNVSQGSDQAINSLRSQMLILLEEHEGIVVFATNLVSNFDKAFESRIIDNIYVPMPNREARAAIIKKMIPSKLPLERPFSDEDFFSASDLIDGLSGREIKNAILKMLLAKADNPESVFGVDDLNKAMIEKMAHKEQLRKEVNGQSQKESVEKKIEATPEQLDKVKDAVKDSIKNAPTIRLDEL